MKSLKMSSGLALLAILGSSILTSQTVESQAPYYQAGSYECYYVRSLNNNFRNSNFRWLDAKSNGTEVGLVNGQSHGTVWQLLQSDKGSLLRSTNQTHHSTDIYPVLDGMSNGTGVQLVNGRSHGTFWQLEHVRGGSFIRSLNNNFRNNNFRWLDGMSNGTDVQLVNGRSHGTLWELKSTSCPDRIIKWIRPEG